MKAILSASKCFLMVVLATSFISLQACSEPEALENLTIEFPDSEQMAITVSSNRNEYQFELPSAMLSEPKTLDKALQSLPESVRNEVITMLETVEPPMPEPISPSLSRSVKALDHLLHSLGQDLSDLKQGLEQNGDEYQRELKENMGELSDSAKELARQAEQQASGFLNKMKHEYVNHIAELIEQGDLSDAEIERLEQAIKEHKRQSQR